MPWLEEGMQVGVHGMQAWLGGLTVSARGLAVITAARLRAYRGNEKVRLRKGRS